MRALSPFRSSVLSLVLPALMSPTLPAQAKDTALPELLRAGRAAMQAGNLPEAERDFRRAVSLAPTSADACLGLGLVEMRRGAVGDAILSIGEATERDPRLQGAHLFLGIAQYQAGQTQAAEQSLGAELALAPENAEALTWLGIVKLGSNHPEEAVAPLDHAASLKGNDPQVLYYQAKAHEAMAESVITRLYKLDPDSVLVHRAQAEALASSGQPEKAIAEYKLALGKQPGNADLVEAMAEQQQKISRFDDATVAYQQELALNPGSAIALFHLGRINVEHGKPEEGVALLRRAAALHAKPAPTDFYLGLGLAELHENEEAAHWLEESLASQPSPFIAQSAYFQLARVYQRLNRKPDADRAIEQLKRLKAQNAPVENAGEAGVSTTGSTASASPDDPR